MALTLLVAAGGAIGAVARYLITEWVQRHAPRRVPLGTLMVNVTGCLLLGAALALMDGSPRALPLTALLAVGFLGDFTTYSALARDAALIARTPRAAVTGRRTCAGAWHAAAYLGASAALGIAALAAGFTATAALR